MENTIFLSYPWGPSCPAYADGERINLICTASLAAGASCNSHKFEASNHIGTHFDFPRHFDPKGRVVTDFPAAYFIHQEVALFWMDLSPGKLVTTEHLQALLMNVNLEASLVLIRTGIGKIRQKADFWQNGTGIDRGVANFLRENFPNLNTIGLDSISLTSLAHRDIGREAHREFLADKNPILIIEDMNLEILAGLTPKSVTALPLRIEQGDGAPCSVIAIL